MMLLIMAHILLLSGILLAQTEITIFPSKDNTLYEHANGSLSNGAGSHLFAGRSGQNLTRRALVAFDLTTSEIPEGAVIESASLTLSMSRTNTSTQTIELHLVLVDWGEGASDAGGEEGSGIASTPGGATWIHSFFDTTLWSNAGGDFSFTVSATQVVNQVGFYSWASTPEMVADVQDWLDNPSRNFGWILIGNEDGPRTAKRFDSKDNPAEENRPVLTVSFTNATSVEDKGNDLPTDFRLAQNYPNPFNPETSIEFELSRTVQAKVEIYNLLGQKVATLLDETRAAGAHELRWDGRNDLGGIVAGGIYIYRLKAGDVTLSRRMLLLK